MRKLSKHNAAFTLVEVITAIVIIVILTSLVIGIAGFANRKAAITRATGEMAMLAAQIEGYKADTGGYPQDYQDKGKISTDKLSPKEDFDPTSKKYSDAGKFLYQELTGDKDLDGVPDKDEPVYMKEYDAKILKADRGGTNNRIIKVYYFQDPFGYPYGYSTAALRGEQDYQHDLRKKPESAKRPTGKDIKGFNTGAFDLWSTGGNKKALAATAADKEKESEWAKWIKNW